MILEFDILSIYDGKNILVQLEISKPFNFASLKTMQLFLY